MGRCTFEARRERPSADPLHPLRIRRIVAPADALGLEPVNAGFSQTGRTADPLNTALPCGPGGNGSKFDPECDAQ